MLAIIFRDYGLKAQKYIYTHANHPHLTAQQLRKDGLTEFDSRDPMAYQLSASDNGHVYSYGMPRTTY